jgi:hypothetical protein
MLTGHPGLGKSLVTIAWAAIVSTGGRWPVEGGRAECGSVLIMSAEDDAADTIRPRLEAAGADLDRCHIIGMVREGSDGDPQRQRGFSLVNDLPLLDKALSDTSDCALVIIDPIAAYLGTTDSHKNAEVRAVLAMLAQLAGKHNVAIVVVSHLRKSFTGDAILQVSGSLAFVAAARAVFVITADKDDETRRLLLPLKNNIGNDRTGYAYQIDAVSRPGEIETCRIAWEPESVTVTADEALAPRDGESRVKKVEAAAGWLRVLLADCPVPQTEVEALAEAAGHSWGTLRRAADEIGVIKAKRSFGGPSLWSLGELPPEAEAPL